MRIAELTVEIQQIPAPTDQEEARADWVAQAMQMLVMEDVSIDAHRNVYGRIPGRQPGPALMVSAHTDTVFPMETDLTFRQDQASGHIFGPGIGDNSAGVAGLLAVADGLQTLLHQDPDLVPPVDIWFVANSGEEGLGDLRGMRAAVDRLAKLPHGLGASLVIEGMGMGRIVHRALGSKRLRISVQAPGGHSWGDFGAGSAVHVLTRLAADLSQLKVTKRPKSAFNIGRIWGGTSVNTIAQQAALELDMRSESPSGLARLVEQTRDIVAHHRRAVVDDPDVSIHVEVIGDRPAGEIPKNHFLVRAAGQALTAAGLNEAPDLRISSTDANVPLSRGIPAVCVGITQGGDAHRLSEWITPEPLGRGTAHLLILTWWAAEWLKNGQEG
jgi:acetylornithine deacetylase/succinyl-diaminopimelate desuccinylase-like protein